MDHQITSEPLTFDTIEKIFSKGLTLKLAQKTKAKISAGRKYLDQKLKNNDTPIYGINTGFGALYNKTISSDDLETLQRNLVMSHAWWNREKKKCRREISKKLMLLLKIQSLSHGHSGDYRWKRWNGWLIFTTTIFCLLFISRVLLARRVIWRRWLISVCR